MDFATQQRLIKERFDKSFEMRTEKTRLEERLDTLEDENQEAQNTIRAAETRLREIQSFPAEFVGQEEDTKDKMMKARFDESFDLMTEKKVLEAKLVSLEDEFVDVREQLKLIVDAIAEIQTFPAELMAAPPVAAPYEKRGRGRPRHSNEGGVSTSGISRSQPPRSRGSDRQKVLSGRSSSASPASEPLVSPPKRKSGPDRGNKQKSTVFRQPQSAPGTYYYTAVQPGPFAAVRVKRRQTLVHVARIEETDEGEICQPKCDRCADMSRRPDSRHDVCRRYTAEAMKKYKVSGCAHCIYSSLRCLPSTEPTGQVQEAHHPPPSSRHSTAIQRNTFPRPTLYACEKVSTPSRITENSQIVSDRGGGVAMLSKAHPTIVEIDGRWTQIWCSGCGDNCGSRWSFYMGIAGLHVHMRTTPKCRIAGIDRIMHEDVVRHCGRHILSDTELNDLRSGKKQIKMRRGGVEQDAWTNDIEIVSGSGTLVRDQSNTPTRSEPDADIRPTTETDTEIADSQFDGSEHNGVNDMQPEHRLNDNEQPQYSFRNERRYGHSFDGGSQHKDNHELRRDQHTATSSSLSSAMDLESLDEIPRNGVELGAPRSIIMQFKNEHDRSVAPVTATNKRKRESAGKEVLQSGRWKVRRVEVVSILD